MNNRGLPPHERRLSLYPATLAGILILLVLMFNGPILWPQDPVKSAAITLFGAFGAVYIILFNLILVPSRKYKPVHAWVHAVLTSIGLMAIFLVSPEKLEIYLSILMVLSTISLAIIAERSQAYLVLISTTAIAIFVHRDHLIPLSTWIIHPGMAIIALIMIESIQRLRHLSQQQVQRLEIINEFSRQVTSSIDTQQVIALVNEAIRAALQADTYYLGLSEGNQINLKLLYDDGEYFTDQRVAMEGTLSGWVIKNQQELFLPDLRRELNIPGIQLVIVGKDRASLSWMGVPMNGAHVHGLIAVGSYQPYAFDRSDLELLANLTQHVTLALDNAYHHALVEEQARLDSLTSVYNHGYFIKLLAQLASEARRSGRPLSLIMLDVDHFKHYNDSYGHLAGDEVLIQLCANIRQHIKTTDAVGRWGGEEFAIALPNADGKQAHQIAERIRQSMSAIRIRNSGPEPIPAPTISQGIAVFPNEADEIIHLIDLADNRLYYAKSRGRDQIEPPPQHWERAPQADEA